MRDQLGRSIPLPLIARIHDATGGNPFYALELAARALESGDVPPRSLAGGGRSGFGVGNLIEANAVFSGPLFDLALAHNAGVVAGAATESVNSLIAHNDFGNNGVAIDLDSGSGTTITQNEMRGNKLATVFAGAYYYDGRRFATNEPNPPNDFQSYPRIGSADRSGSTTMLTGSVPRPQTFHRRGYTIELYAQPSCGLDSVSPGQGETWLGSDPLTPNGLGDFTESFPLAPAGEGAVSATITAPDGSTSEFSPCLTIGHTANSFTGSGVTPVSSTLRVTNGTAGGARDALVAVKRTGVGKGNLEFYSARRSRSVTARAHGYFKPPAGTQWRSPTADSTSSQARSPQLNCQSHGST